MKSIELTQPNDQKVTIFIEKMAYIRSHSKGSVIGFGSEEVVVKESHDEIKSKLSSADRFFIV